MQIAAVGQMLQNPILDQAEHAMIFQDPNTRRYLYFIGMTEDYANSLSTRDYLRKNGFGDAFITAHYNGVKLTRKELVEMSDEYPDLLKLLDSNN